MSRRVWPLAVIALIAVAAPLILVARDRASVPTEPAAPPAPSLTYVLINNELGPLSAVVGTSGQGAPGALVIPGEVSVTIPGQGDATMVEAADLPLRQTATTAANLLGAWVDHYVVIGRLRLSAVVDRVGGIQIGGRTRTGAEVVAMLEEPGAGRTEAFRQVLGGVLAAEPDWQADDFFETDSAAGVDAALTAASSASVQILSVEEVADGVFTSSPSAVAGSFAAAFGVPEPEIVPVIVLNGSGVPGVGELVAEHIVPGGFRIVVSENASNFDHVETLVVVGSADDVALGDRVRDLLGAGGVSVSVSSGIAPVTIVVGKDFTG